MTRSTCRSACIGRALNRQSTTARGRRPAMSSGPAASYTAARRLSILAAGVPCTDRGRAMTECSRGLWATKASARGLGRAARATRGGLR